MMFVRPRVPDPKGAIRLTRVAPLLLLLACMEIAPPVQEKLSLAFDAAGGLEVALDVAIADPGQRFQDEPAVRRRIAEARWLYENGKDDWAARFAGVTWLAETCLTRKSQGGLVAVRRTGSLKDPGGLSTFLSGTGITAATSRGEGYAELCLYPGAPQRATRDQRAAMGRLLDAWVPAVHAYHLRLAALYTYLDGHPERARACFGEMFSSRLDDGVKEALPPLTEEEQALLDSLGDATGKVADALLYTRDEAYSPEELSRLVYDPFPAPVQVALPGDVLEVEGFDPEGPRTVVYRGTSLWRALSKIEEKAVTPDPLMLILPWGDLPEVMADRSEDGSNRPKVDLDALAAAPRRAAAGQSEDQLKAAVVASLSPASAYRVRWRTPASPPPEAAQSGPSSESPP